MGPPSTSDDAICLERKAPRDLRLSVARVTLALPSWLQTDLCADPELSGSGEDPAEQSSIETVGGNKETQNNKGISSTNAVRPLTLQHHKLKGGHL